MAVPRGMRVAGSHGIAVLGVDQVLLRMALTTERSIAVCKDIVKEGGEVVAEDARRRAPRATGRLQASIGVKRVYKKGPAGARASVRWGTEAFYGMFQERGFAHLGGGWVQNPFLYPAMRDKSSAVEQIAAVKWAAVVNTAGR